MRVHSFHSVLGLSLLTLSCGQPARPPAAFDAGFAPDTGNIFDAGPTDDAATDALASDLVTDAGVLTDGAVLPDGTVLRDATLDATLDAADAIAPIDAPGMDGASHDGAATDRPVVFFDLGTDAGPPPRVGPRLLSPLSGSASASLAPTFTWAAFPAATGYRVEFSVTRAFTVVEATFAVTTPTYTPGTARPPGHVFWRVIPQLPGGSAGPASLVWEIDLGLVPGDLTGDVYADAVVGTAARSSGSGAVDVYPGAATLPSTPSITLVGTSGEAFGSAVSNTGDINADGYNDLVVGAPANSHHAPGAGRAYVYLGGPHFSTSPALVIDGPSASAAFGSTVAILGDVDGDGYDDFAVGAPLLATTGPATGAVYVYFGAATPTAARFETLGFATPGDQFGRALAAAGDVDGDGYVDVIVGAPHNTATGVQSGQAYVYLGGPVFNFVPDMNLPGAAGNVQAGTAVAGLGDFNGDGYADLAVGAPFDPTGAPAGQVYLVYGSYPVHTTVDLHLTGESGEQFGRTLAGIGDVNNDGFGDLAVGGPFNGDIGVNAGHVYFFPGSSRPTSVIGATLANSVGGDQFGGALSPVGDMDHDGFNDWAIGAPFAPSVGVTGPGTAYLYRGSMGLPGAAAMAWRGTGTDQYGGAVAVFTHPSPRAHPDHWSHLADVAVFMPQSTRRRAVALSLRISGPASARAN